MSLFDSAAANTLTAALAVFGDPAVIEAPSGDVTITAVLRRTPREWAWEGESVAGSGWQLVCRTSDLPTPDCGQLKGLQVTTKSRRYTILRATPDDGGGTVLELGYSGG